MRHQPVFCLPGNFSGLLNLARRLEKANWETNRSSGQRKKGAVGISTSGRYGQAALFDEFQKGLPGDQKSPRSTAPPEISSPTKNRGGGSRRKKTIRGHLQGGGPNSSYSLLITAARCSTRSSPPFILPEVLDESKMVRVASISSRTARTNSSLSTLRCPGVPRPVLQLQPRQRERKEFKSYWESDQSKNGKGKSPRSGPPRPDSASTCSSITTSPELGPEVYQSALWGAMDVTFGDRRHDHRLAGGWGRKFAICHGLPANREGEASGQGLPVEDFSKPGTGKKGQPAEHRRAVFDQPDQKAPPHPNRGAGCSSTGFLSRKGTDCHAKSPNDLYMASCRQTLGRVDIPKRYAFPLKNRFGRRKEKVSRR